MNVSLLYPSTQEHNAAHPRGAELIQDLNLDVVLNAMARGDKYIRDVAAGVMLETPPISADAVLYRQAALKDAMSNHVAVRGLYALAGTAVDDCEAHVKATAPSWARMLPVSEKLGVASRLLEILLSALDALAVVLAEHKATLKSDGFMYFIQDFDRRFDSKFRSAARAQLEKLLAIREGTVIEMSARVGAGLKGRSYTLRRAYASAKNKRETKGKCEIKLFTASLTAKAEQLRDAGLNKPYRIINAVNNRLLAYFKALRHDAAFYVGCLNLHAALAHIGAPIVMPEPSEAACALTFDGLVDVSLALLSRAKPVANTADVDGKRHIVVTGANQGGKSTFARSVGCAQLMMQCGMFVTAARFSADMRAGVYTHFSRKEDESMSGGKLDEELRRMSGIIDMLPRGALLIMNESFASTSEYQAREIAEQIIGALLERDVKVLYVTHLYEYALTTHERGDKRNAFLIADRDERGGRPFTLREGVPERTSYGEDLFEEVLET